MGLMSNIHSHWTTAGAIRFRSVLWIVTSMASAWWVTWWIVSSDRPRSSDDPVKAAIARLDSALSTRAFRPSDVPTLLTTQLGLVINFSPLGFGSDGKDGSAFLFQALPFIVVAMCSYGAIELDRYIRRCCCTCKKKIMKKRSRIGHTVTDNDRGISRGLCTQSAAAAASWTKTKSSCAATTPSGYVDDSTADDISGTRYWIKVVREKARLMNTYPLVVVKSRVAGTFIILSAVEAIVLLAFLTLLLYTFGRRTYLDFIELEIKYRGMRPDIKLKSAIPLPIAKLGRASYNMARTALIPFALLWVPVSRGSPFLRVLGIPFERAVRYHVWLATLMLAMLVMHGAGYATFYVATHRAHKMISWETDAESCAVLAGVVALGIALIMATTAQPVIRRRLYELFLFTHVLSSPLFFVFVLYHAVWTLHLFLLPVLLFLVDRLLRFVQSRRLLPVVFAQILPHSSAIELRIAAPHNQPDDDDDDDIDDENFVPSSWYLRFPSVSMLQWHMFSAVDVRSSSIGHISHGTARDGKRHRRQLELTFIIKPLGNWTRRLKEQLVQTYNNDSAAAISSSSNHSSGRCCPFSLKAGLEGPYGAESSFYLKYNTLVLVGGGIGITPLLAILRDLLARYRRGRHVGLPRCVKLYHCVRTTDELAILNSLDPNKICPNYGKRGLNISVFAYITRGHVLTPNIDHTLAAPSNVVHQVVDTNQSTCKADQTKKNTSARDSDNTIAYDLSTFNFGEPFRNHRATTPESTSSNNELVTLVRGQTLMQTTTQHKVQLEGANDECALRWGNNNMIGSKGEPVWVASTVLCSIVGFYVVWTVSTILIVRKNKRLLLNYEEAHVVVASMIFATLLFGGFILLLWGNSYKSKNNDMSTKPLYLLDSSKKSQSAHIAEEDDEETVLCNHTASAATSVTSYTSPWCGTLHLGSRPPWTDIFRAMAKEYQGENIGVLVSGPQAMQIDIASECRRQTKFFDVKKSSNVFHYHSVSFEI